MPVLVRTPPSCPKESLLGYVLRVSEQNGYDTPCHVLAHAGIVSRQSLTAGFPVEKLAAVLGESGDALSRLSYQEFSGAERHFKILGHPLGQGLSNRPLRLKHPSFCPQCVAEQGYIDAFWDLSAAVCCPRHGSYLLLHCPSCKVAISWFRPGLLKCKCGAAFDEVDPLPASPTLQALMALFYSKLHGLPFNDTENTCRFPLSKLNQIPLDSLLQIARRLGRWNSKSQALTALDDRDIFMAAAESLQDWPTGFLGMLRRLGEQALVNGLNVSGLGKQFGSFYSTTLKSRVVNIAASFLREEFISFGRFHWGHAFVDGKFSENNRDMLGKNESRFISATDFAKRFGLGNETINRLIRTGAISTTRIKTTKTERFLVDMEKSQLPVGSMGILTVGQAARQAGLPVSVLRWARRAGLYPTKMRGKFQSSWHQEDVKEFVERGLAMAPPVASKGEWATVGEAMRLHLGSTDAKADIIGSIFDGRLRVIGRTGDNFAGLVLDRKELYKFVRLKRIGVLNDTYSAIDLQKETGLDSLAVSDAVAKGMLEMQVVNGHKRLTKRSLDSFRAQYVLLVNLANELSTTTAALLRLCCKNDIPVIYLKREATDAQQPLLLRVDECRLLAAWAPRLR